MDKLRVSAFGRGAVHETALSQGIYEAEGLEVELDVTQSSKSQLRELIDGVWDLVHTNADNVVWWNEDNDADLIIVLATEGKPNQDLVVRPEIAGYADLRGKPIAVDAAESGFVTPLRVLLREAGLDEGRDYTFVGAGATDQRVDAMRDGSTYAAMINSGSDLAADGFRVLDTINRLYTNYAGPCAARRDWTAANEDLVVRYLRAQLRAAASLAGDGWAPSFSWAGLTEIMEMRRDVGFLRGAVDPYRFADDSSYRRAVEGLAP